MHETRNFVIIVLLILASLWALAAWLLMADPFGAASAGVWAQRVLATLAALMLGGVTWYALRLDDKLADHLGATVGPVYFEAGGLSFMPALRVREDGQAELHLYYQNRFENYCQAIVHLRPPREAFVTRPGGQDLHFAFKADGGEFGVLRQPIGVPARRRGEVVEVLLAAAARFPRAHGDALRRREGVPCGTLVVDWDQAFRPGVHEAPDAVELIDPCTLHLSLPAEAHEAVAGPGVWKHEVLEPGPTQNRVLT